nr:RNA ligase family protein [Rhodococcus sp. USK13]
MSEVGRQPIAPMLATLGLPPESEGWATEFKWDGCRSIVTTCGDSPVLWSRSGNSVEQSYPEVVAALAAAVGERKVVLDGELVALDHGRPSFGRLQHRMNVTRPTASLCRRFAVTFYAFDLLSADGVDLTRESYLDRRAALAALNLPGPRLQVPPHWVDVDSRTMLEVARQHALEGCVFKKVTSIYLPGARSRSWVKSVIRRRASLLVGGWSAGSGMQRNVVGSLLLGAYDLSGDLVYVGHVGTGFTNSMRRQLRDRLVEWERPTSPFRGFDQYSKGVHWTESRLVVDVEYREFTGAGLRHPSFKGIRADVSHHDVQWHLLL